MKISPVPALSSPGTVWTVRQLPARDIISQSHLSQTTTNTTTWPDRHQPSYETSQTYSLIIIIHYQTRWHSVIKYLDNIYQRGKLNSVFLCGLFQPRKGQPVKCSLQCIGKTDDFSIIFISFLTFRPRFLSAAKLFLSFEIK